MKISIDTEKKVIILDDEIQLLDLLKAIENLEQIIGNGKDWKVIAQKQTFPISLPPFTIQPNTPITPFPITVDRDSTNIYPKRWNEIVYLVNI